MAIRGAGIQETDNQAMTEVALGLAMAFFALMILAMLSMSVPAAVGDLEYVGVPYSDKASAMKPDKKPGLEAELIVVGSVDAERVNKSAVEKDSSSAKKVGHDKANSTNDRVIIYYQGQYLDSQLEVIDVTNLSGPQKMVLALAPDLPLKTIIAVRSEISAPNLVITELDEAWLSRLSL